MSNEVELEVLYNAEGYTVYLNDHQIAGENPQGKKTIVSTLVPMSEISGALGGKVKEIDAPKAQSIWKALKVAKVFNDAVPDESYTDKVVDYTGFDKNTVKEIISKYAKKTTDELSASMEAALSL